MSSHVMNAVLRTLVGRVSRGGLALSVLVAVLLVSGVARADELSKVDEAVNRWKSLDIKYKIVTTKNGGDPTNLKLRMRMRVKSGENEQITEISEPADMKGTKVLIKSPTEMYIYLPAFRKIRRIASHVTEQGFLGTALSQRDMSLTRYAKYYTAKKTKEAGHSLTLVLTAKSDDAPYPKLEVDVDTTKWLPSEIRYFNDKGKHIKTEERSDYECKGNICLPGKQKMTDLTTGVSSTLKMHHPKIDPDFDDKIFSKRYLMK
jgi:outer membrane lipoprotein-sorting protein